MTLPPRAPRPPWLVDPCDPPTGTRWDWPAAALGAAYGLPAAVLVHVDVRLGLALAVGCHSGRFGALLSGVLVLAVAAIALLAVASALLAARSRAAPTRMPLGRVSASA